MIKNFFLYDQIKENADDFSAGVQSIADALGTRSEWLMLVMYFESKLNPQAKNPFGSATGLLQFTAATATDIGTSTAALYNMNNVEQLQYVQRYLQRFKGRLNTLTDVYLSVFYPAAIGRPDTYMLNLSPQWVEANKIFDSNKDGKITVGEISKKINDYFNTLAAQTNYKISVAAGGIVALIVSIGLIYIIFK